MAEKCKEKCEVYSRVTGYFRPVSNWNKGKKEEFNDRKTFKVVGILAALACLFLAGCGHNAIQYGDGVGFDFGVNPEEWKLSFNLRYGKILSACVRENAELEITGGNDTTGNGGNATGGATTKTESSVKIKIGRQCTGYYVDAIKAGAKPEQLDKYTATPEQSPAVVK